MEAGERDAWRRERVARGGRRGCHLVRPAFFRGVSGVCASAAAFAALLSSYAALQLWYWSLRAASFFSSACRCARHFLVSPLCLEPAVKFCQAVRAVIAARFTTCHREVPSSGNGAHTDNCVQSTK